MFLNILVAVDGSPASLRALDEAVDLSRAVNSKLTLIAVAPPPPHYSAYAGMSSERLSDEAGRWADGVLAKALQQIPDDVLAHTVRREGHAGREIVDELTRGGYDLVVLGTRARSRAQEGLLGSVNAHVHFNARVPILSVPAED